MTEGDGDSVDTSYQQVPSQKVIKAIAAAEGIPPEQLHPPAYESLHTVIDPEALDALFAPRSDGTPRPGGEVSFPFCNYDVTVERDGSVVLEERTESTE
ncbi:HalOD1 output domain-containing protein [Natronorubrum sp. FCH18a]|uniref:HalOD1 output domain-containing protein n=1 Tax=Natronorubrum sp. FCH18a TaxID=3447018 RepID=UPI003F50FAF1